MQGVQALRNEAYFKYLEDKNRQRTWANGEKYLFRGTGGGKDNDHPGFLEKLQVVRGAF
jgi:hypothetical protein